MSLVKHSFDDGPLVQSSALLRSFFFIWGPGTRNRLSQGNVVRRDHLSFVSHSGLSQGWSQLPSTWFHQVVSFIKGTVVVSIRTKSPLN